MPVEPAFQDILANNQSSAVEIIDALNDHMCRRYGPEDPSDLPRMAARSARRMAGMVYALADCIGRMPIQQEETFEKMMAEMLTQIVRAALKVRLFPELDAGDVSSIDPTDPRAAELMRHSPPPSDDFKAHVERKYGKDLEEFRRERATVAGKFGMDMEIQRP